MLERPCAPPPPPAWAGVCYYVGMVRVSPDPQGSWINTLLYGSVYRGLLMLSRSDVEAWRLPYGNVVELGITIRV